MKPIWWRETHLVALYAFDGRIDPGSIDVHLTLFPSKGFMHRTVLSGLTNWNMQITSRLAAWAFHFYLGLSSFYAASGLPSAIFLEQLAVVGTASAAAMWLVIDAMRTRRPIPFMSLWIAFAFWLFVLPYYYFSTRGRTGLRRFLLHAGAAILSTVIGAALGALSS